jgi:hypothetical protein
MAHFYPRAYERDNILRMRPQTYGAWVARKSANRMREGLIATLKRMKPKA